MNIHKIFFFIFFISMVGTSNAEKNSTKILFIDNMLFYEKLKESLDIQLEQTKLNENPNIQKQALLDKQKNRLREKARKAIKILAQKLNADAILTPSIYDHNYFHSSSDITEKLVNMLNKEYEKEINQKTIAAKKSQQLEKPSARPILFVEEDRINIACWLEGKQSLELDALKEKHRKLHEKLAQHSCSKDCNEIHTAGVALKSKFWRVAREIAAEIDACAVLSYSADNYIDPQHNITDTVIDILNEEYLKSINDHPTYKQ